jgi:UDP-N-acetylmuramoyl-tripeptide--D-alanyl-D-alanine ligase
MNLKIKVSELAQIIGGKVIYIKKNVEIKSFITDTRVLKRGDIFWALKGKNFDGNDFIDEAIKKGSIGVIANKRLSEISNSLLFFIKVSDTLKALHKLAQYHISRFNVTKISITGSNGKTTTKEMIYKVLSSHQPTVYNRGNLNNEYGLPLSVLETNEKHKFGVFEIGASQRGEVKKLSSIINPDIAVITTIGPEHLEFFKTMTNVFKTETEVIETLNKDGYIIINGDNEYLSKLKGRKNVISFGYKKNNDLVIETGEKHSFFIYKSKRYNVSLKNPVKHNYLNAASAFIVGLLLKIPIRKILKSIEDFEGVPLRMQIIKRKNSIIILDAYNANPQSMELAIDEISRYSPFALVLGDMKELGRYSRKYHLELAKKILNVKPDFVFLIGPEIKVCYDFLHNKIKNVKYYSDVKIAQELKSFIKSSDGLNFLIKASRTMRLEELIEQRD